MEQVSGFDVGAPGARDTPALQDYGAGSASAAPLFRQFAHWSDVDATRPVEEALAAPPISEPAVDPASAHATRFLDVVLALVILGFALPLLMFCAMSVFLSGPGGVIFCQTRIGRNGREFTCLKFRTMQESAERSLDLILNASETARTEWTSVHKIIADPRVTFIGRFLRRYSLDELPQLINVLRGDMSVVGPRPIVADEIEKYGPRFADYCRVRPGLTGLWQVSGAHALSYEERVLLDSEYARSKSPGLDLLILLKTVPVVLLGQNQ